MARRIWLINGSSILAGLRRVLLAVQFLTILPLPSLKNVSATEVRGSSMFFPLVGGLLGLCLWAMELILRTILPGLVSTTLALTAYTLLTGALHLDGLMDTADALGSRKPREQALEIMKDSRVGAMAVVAAVMTYSGKLAVLNSLSPAAIGAMVLPPVLSRWAMVVAMKMAPAARGQGGLAGVFAQRISASSLWIATFIAAAFTFAFTFTTGSLWLVAGIWLGCGLATVLAIRLFTQRFGGMTGDTYGALNEIVEWIGWVVGLALFLHA